MELMPADAIQNPSVATAQSKHVCYSSLAKRETKWNPLAVAQQAAVMLGKGR